MITRWATVHSDHQQIHSAERPSSISAGTCQMAQTIPTASPVGKEARPPRSSRWAANAVHPSSSANAAIRNTASIEPSIVGLSAAQSGAPADSHDNPAAPAGANEATTPTAIMRAPGCTSVVKSAPTAVRPPASALTIAPLTIGTTTASAAIESPGISCARTKLAATQNGTVSKATSPKYASTSRCS